MQTQLKQVPPIYILSRRDRLTIPQIPAHSGPAIQSLFDALARLNAEPIGDLTYIYHDCTGDPADPFDLEIALPVAQGLAAQLPAPLTFRTAPAFQCLAFDYVGPMTAIGQAWMQLVSAVKAAGHEPTGQSREIYKKWIDFNSPDNVTELQQGIE